MTPRPPLLGSTLLATVLLAGQSASVLAQANTLMRQQRFADVIRVLNQHVRLEPRAEVDVFLMLASAHQSNGNAMMALDACQQGEKLHPQSAPIAKCIARLLLARNPLLLDTERYLQTSVSHPDVRDPEANYLYAQWACLNNRDELCVEQASKALALSGENPPARLQLHTLIGVAQDRSSHPELAQAAFESALAANRQLPVFDHLTAFEYVRFLGKRNRNQRAMAVNEEILQHSPVFAPALLEQAKLLSRQGNQEESARYAERALANAGADLDLERSVRSHLARTYFALGQREKALQQQEWLRRNTTSSK